jgi:hypothetical protein
VILPASIFQPTVKIAISRIKEPFGSDWPKSVAVGVDVVTGVDLMALAKSSLFAVRGNSNCGH